MRVTFAMLAVAIALAACALLVPRTPAPALVHSAVPEVIGAHYASLARAGDPVFTLDASRSVVVVEVRRAGPLANLGHDHVVASYSLAGYVAPSSGEADIFLPLRTLTVDDPALRRLSGFETQPSPSDIDGTRANMLDKVLHVDEHPIVSVHLQDIVPGAGDVAARPSVTLHGTTRYVKANIRLEETVAAIRATGTMQVLQTDFGVLPFSVLGGAIQVRDALDVRFDIVARPAFP